MIEPAEHVQHRPDLDLTVWSWAAENPRWIALVAHGYGEHAGRYQWLAERLCAAGALVCAPDMRGHGTSDGERVLIPDADLVVADLDAVRRDLVADLPGLPVVLIGHSLGGMVAARFAQTHPGTVHAVVLSSPVLGTWHVLDLLEERFIPDTPIPPHTLSRDPAVGRVYADDPLVWHGPFLRPTLIAIDRCLEQVNDGPPLDVPALWLHGEDDELVPEADTRTGIDRLRGAAFHEHIYPGARHELFNEINAHDVVDDVLAFVTKSVLS